MVKERERPRAPPAQPTEVAQPTEPVQIRPTQPMQATHSTLPLQQTFVQYLLQDGRGQPEFGKPSPPRNPLRTDRSNIFIRPKPNKPRPEHHLPPASSTSSPPAFQASRSSQGLKLAPAPFASTLRMPSAVFVPGTASVLPPLKPSFSPEVVEIAKPTNLSNYPAAAKPHTKTGISPDIVEIKKPMNFANRSTAAPPRPLFSSLSGYGSFQPGCPQYQSDLTKKEEDEFDPDRALRDDKFGAVDPYSYVDTAQANENIKALLEGAFEDEDDKPKRLRKKNVLEVPRNDLAAKLQALDVGKPEEENGAADDEEDEEDGTVEGLNIKLLPHQVEGVAWMMDKEIGKRKKNGVLPKGGILADDVSITLFLSWRALRSES